MFFKSSVKKTYKLDFINIKKNGKKHRLIVKA